MRAFCLSKGHRSEPQPASGQVLVKVTAGDSLDQTQEVRMAEEGKQMRTWTSWVIRLSATQGTRSASEAR